MCSFSVTKTITPLAKLLPRIASRGGGVRARSAPVQDPGLGGGKLGTTSASPSITFAVSPARAANIALIAAMAFDPSRANKF